MKPELQQLLEAVAAATEDDATEEAKRRGVAACRDLGSLLGAIPGQPLVQSQGPASALGYLATQLQAAKPTVVLDAIIAKLGGLLPEDDEGRGSRQRLDVPFVPVPTDSE